MIDRIQKILPHQWVKVILGNKETLHTSVDGCLHVSVWDCRHGSVVGGGGGYWLFFQRTQVQFPVLGHLTPSHWYTGRQNTNAYWKKYFFNVSNLLLSKYCGKAEENLLALGKWLTKIVDELLYGRHTHIHTPAHPWKGMHDRPK